MKIKVNMKKLLFVGLFNIVLFMYSICAQGGQGVYFLHYGAYDKELGMLSVLTISRKDLYIDAKGNAYTFEPKSRKYSLISNQKLSDSKKTFEYNGFKGFTDDKGNVNQSNEDGTLAVIGKFSYSVENPQNSTVPVVNNPDLLQNPEYAYHDYKYHVQPKTVEKVVVDELNAELQKIDGLYFDENYNVYHFDDKQKKYQLISEVIHNPNFSDQEIKWFNYGFNAQGYVDQKGFVHKVTYDDLYSDYREMNDVKLAQLEPKKRDPKRDVEYRASTRLNQNNQDRTSALKPNPPKRSLDAPSKDLL